MKLTSGSYLEVHHDGTLVMVITPGPHLASSWYCMALGSAAMVPGVLLRDLLLVVIGTLFIVAGVFFLHKAHSRTTVISPNGSITVTTVRVFGGKKTVKTFSLLDVNRVDYGEGFDDKTTIGRMHRYSSVEITLKDGRNIQVLYRRGVKYIQPLYLPSFVSDAPLTEEASRISAQLEVPLNTIMLKKPADIKNIYTPNDSNRY